MKKIFSIALFFYVCNTFSQNGADTVKHWTRSGFFGLNFSQTALNNWQGGGQDNVAFNTIFNFQATYKKNKFNWDNKIDAQYGLMKPGTNKLYRKNIDQIFAMSRINVDAFAKHFYYATQADIRTQWAPGYNYVGDSIAGKAISDIFSPAFIQLALGLDYKPKDYFSVFLSPLAGRIIIVERQYLADIGAFGATKAKLDANGNIIAGTGKNITYGFGGRLVLKFKKDIFKNVNLDSYLDIFSNYLDNPQNMVVVFNNLITFKINKFFTANVICQMYYDDRSKTIYDWNKDGKFDNPKDINGPRLQMITTLGIGFGYKF